MRKLTLSLVGASLLTSPVAAAAAQYDTDVRSGAFAGARIRIPLGGRSASRPRATLTIAPTLSRLSGSAATRTTIGEGVTLELGRRPTLTIAGIRADQALGFTPVKGADPDHKLGVSTGGWIAIGLGAAVVAGGLFYAHLVHEVREHSE